MQQLLKLKRIILAAIAILATRGTVIARVIALPVIISIAIQTIAFYTGLPILVFASRVIDWLLFAFVATSLHRVCLLGEHSLPKFGALTSPSRNDGMYILAAFLLGVGLTAYTYTVSHIVRLLDIEQGQPTEGFSAIFHFVFNWFWVLLMLFLIARLSLWLPAVALGHRYSVREIWRLGRRNSMLLMSSIIGLPVVFYYLFSFPGNAVIAITPLNLLIKMIPYLIGLLLLSVTYAEISQGQLVWRSEETDPDE